MTLHLYPKGVAVTVLGALFLFSNAGLGKAAKRDGQALSVETATKHDVLAALSASIKQSPESGPQMLSSILSSRPDLAAEAIRTAIEAARPAGCGSVSSITSAAVTGAPSRAASTMELSARLAPGCKQALEASAGAKNSADQESSFEEKSSSSAKASKRAKKCPVCHNGHEVLLKCGKQVDKFLRNHPGDFAGSCHPTPVTNL